MRFSCVCRLTLVGLLLTVTHVPVAAQVDRSDMNRIDRAFHEQVDDYEARQRNNHASASGAVTEKPPRVYCVPAYYRKSAFVPAPYSNYIGNFSRLCTYK